LAAEADFLGEEHPAHAAAAQLLQDAVLVTDRLLKPLLEVDPLLLLEGMPES
jgi:hypothetical protein